MSINNTNIASFRVSVEDKSQRRWSQEFLAHCTKSGAQITSIKRITNYYFESCVESNHPTKALPEIKRGLIHPLVQLEHPTLPAPSDRLFQFTVTPQNHVKLPIIDSLQLWLDSITNATVRAVSVTHTFIGNGTIETPEFQALAEYHLYHPLTHTLQAGDHWPSSETSVPEHDFPTVDLRLLGEQALAEISKTHRLALNNQEMRAIQRHYQQINSPTPLIELLTIAQTWSEHCVHKTFTASVTHGDHEYNNLFNDTIVAATEAINHPLAVSVFSDNAGIISFDDDLDLCFKAETHNHPSAIEPYGGSATGLGGVIRDILGAGLGARPIASTNVFCFGPQNLNKKDNDSSNRSLDPSGFSPQRLRNQIIAGLRDYGNRVGIPTVAGSVHYHDRYTKTPVVLAGCLGTLPKNHHLKTVTPGDFVVLIGGRTGQDGIAGVNFSSEALDAASVHADRSAVQIGTPLTEQMLIEPLIQARDLGLINSITDCGGGGLSSALGEMAAKTGLAIDLSEVPLKHTTLSAAHIWISESQERMCLAVSEENWPTLNQLFKDNHVLCTKLGQFTDDNQLRLTFDGHEICNLSLDFLHGARPQRKLNSNKPDVDRTLPTNNDLEQLTDYVQDHARALLFQCLAHSDVSSRRSITQQYDHTVQGRTVIAPTTTNDAPSDGVVMLPSLDSNKGAVLGIGFNARQSEIDCYRMAQNAIDEAIRNCVAAGADPEAIFLLDNFIWGDIANPNELGQFVEAAQACHDYAIKFGSPFISGKDSLNNCYRTKAGATQSILPTLIISALGQTANAAASKGTVLSSPEQTLILIGETRPEFGGSCLYEFVPTELRQHPVVSECAPVQHKSHAKLVHKLIQQTNFIEACHDCSDGGLAVAIAEMCLGHNIGASLDLSTVHDDFATALFAESSGRYLLAIATDQLQKAWPLFNSSPASSPLQIKVLGQSNHSEQLSIRHKNNQFSWDISDLANAFFEDRHD